MFRYFVMTLIATLLSSLMSLTTLSQAEALLSNADAKSIVLRYLDALSQGDTQTIKQLLGEDLLESSLSRLDNPDYSSMLTNIYSLADYDVVDTSSVDERNVAVDTIIKLSPDEIITPRFIVAKVNDGEEQALKIVDERESADANY